MKLFYDLLHARIVSVRLDLKGLDLADRDRRLNTASAPNPSSIVTDGSGIVEVQRRFTSLSEWTVEKYPSSSQLLLSIEPKEPVRVPEPTLLMIPTQVRVLCQNGTLLGVLPPRFRLKVALLITTLPTVMVTVS